MRTLDFILQNRVIVAIRNVYGEDLLSLADSLLEGGLAVCEIAFNQKDAESIKKTTCAIESLAKKEGLVVGAGTVLNEEQLRASFNSGAGLIVSPNTDADIIKKTKEFGIVSVPGAFTPTEVVFAHKSGADIVKLFPASVPGTGYVKDLVIPLNHIKLFASGGINEENIADYLKAGCAGVFVSSYVASQELIKNKDFNTIKSRAKRIAALLS